MQCAICRDLCVPSRGPRSSCTKCKEHKVHCTKAQGPASHQAAVEKGHGSGKRAGPSSKLKSAPVVVEGGSVGSGLEQQEVVDVLRMMRDGQRELLGVMRDIRDEFQLQNDLAAYKSFRRLNYRAEMWPGGWFSEWFAHWCHEDLSSVTETAHQQTKEQVRMAQEVMEAWECGEAEGSGRD